MFKKWLYTKFANFYLPYGDSHPLLKDIARLLEKVLGYAVFEYGGIKLTAGPYAYLDHFIIKKYNINPHVTSAISQYLSQGGVFLDVGANHGVFSLLAAKNSNVNVFAFEPSPRELKRLWKNLQLNSSCNNISVLSYGLGEIEGKCDFLLNGNDNPGMNSLPNILGKGKKVQCHFSSIRKLLSDDILKQARLCKLDVEGQEMFILNSLKNHMDLLKQCVFVIEMHPRFTPKTGFKIDDIYQFFWQAGYKSQFGVQKEDEKTWQDFFYHPEYASELIFSERIN